MASCSRLGAKEHLHALMRVDNDQMFDTIYLGYLDFLGLEMFVCRCWLLGKYREDPFAMSPMANSHQTKQEATIVEDDLQVDGMRTPVF